MSTETYFIRLATMLAVFGVAILVLYMSVIWQRNYLRGEYATTRAELCRLYYADAQTGQDTVAVIRDRGCEVPGERNPVWSCGDTTGCFAPVPEDGR